MGKLKLFFFVIILTPLICAVFGIIHDQVTYTISPEYFTKFKFIQFHLIRNNMPLQMSERVAAIIVGVMATWWVGIPIGLIYGFMLLFFRNTSAPYSLYFQTIALTFLVTILTSITGFFYGKFHLQNTGVDWYLPENLVDTKNFIVVGSIHNFSYLGGALGLMAGSLFLVIKKQ
jgi:hypothetical protein